MKVKIFGCPSKPDLTIDVAASASFKEALAKAEAAAGVKLAGFYSVHVADAKGDAVMEAPMDEALAGMGLGEGSALRLVPTGSASPRGKPTPRERMVALYQKYDPSKVGTVDAMLAKFPGREEAVIKKLVEKYGPEPEQGGAPTPAATPAATPRAAVATPAATPSATPRPAATPRERMVALYQKYDPSKVGTVDAMLAKFPGREEAVIKKLVEKYGPEPEPEAPAAVPPPAEAPVPAPPAKAPPKAKAPPAAAVAKAVAAPSPVSPPPAPVEAAPAPMSLRDRMVALYNHYDPAKASSVDALLAKYKGKEEQILAKMVDKYGPEPPAPSAQPAAAEPKPATPTAAAPASTPASTRARVLRYCEAKAPAFAPKVDELIAKYGGNEAEIMEKLTKKFGPEPAVEDAPAPAEAEPEDDPSEDAAPKDRAATLVPQPAAAAAAPVAAAPAPAPPSKERYLPALTRLVAGMGEALDTAARREAFATWRRFAAAQKAKAALASGLATGPDGGPYDLLASGGDRIFSVASLETYFAANTGTNADTVLSAALAAALQQLQAAAASSLPQPLSAAAPQSLAAKGLLVRDAPDVAAHVAAVASSMESTVAGLATERASTANALEETKGDLARTATSLADLRLYVEELEKKSAADEAALARLQGVEAALASSQATEEAQRREIEVLKRAHQLEEERGAAAKQENVKLRRELADERKGLPSDMELFLSQKDQSIASLQQELARVRGKARGAKLREEELAGTIQGLEEKVQQLEISRSMRRGASASASPRGAAGSPRFAGSMASRSGAGPSLLLASASPAQRREAPLGASSLAPMPRYERSEFEPSARPPAAPAYAGSASYAAPHQHVDPDTYLAEADDPTLDVEVQKKALLPDRGGCPHCLIPLTAFMGDRYGSSPDDSAKVAFCFSCRRSFTGIDLARRDAKARAAKSALGTKALSQTRI